MVTNLRTAITLSVVLDKNWSPRRPLSFRALPRTEVAEVAGVLGGEPRQEVVQLYMACPLGFDPHGTVMGLGNSVIAVTRARNSCGPIYLRCTAY
jgi:hypothetical protein